VTLFWLHFKKSATLEHPHVFII